MRNSEIKTQTIVKQVWLVMKATESWGYLADCPIRFERYFEREAEAIDYAACFPLAFVIPSTMLSNPRAMEIAREMNARRDVATSRL